MPRTPTHRWYLQGLLVSLAMESEPALTQAPEPAAASASADELVGLWKAKRWYDADTRGPLVLQKTRDGWTADFIGHRYPVTDDGKQLTFTLPDGDGDFIGDVPAGDGVIEGHWITHASRVHGSRYAVPITLQSEGSKRWRGIVAPRDDTLTLYLMVQKRPDGTVGAFMRNPERNMGVFYDVDHIVRDGAAVNLVGHRRGGKTEQVLLTGTYDAENALWSVAFPDRGGTYDFRREGDDSDFYPRGINPGRYAWQPPLARDDGWPIETPEQVNIDRAGLEQFIQMIIDTTIESVHTPEIDAVLIARHGKLALEEYFHGEHRDKLHETRSAAKSITATVVGAAIQAGEPVKLSSPVYEVMNGGTFPTDLEPRKRSMTLEHLLMMRSGYFCDDSNPDAPGNESTMLDQNEEGDYYAYTLRLPMDSDPDEKSVYCSINPNLALGVVGRASGQSPLDLFDRLLAGPLQIRTYAWPLSPAGQPYGGGGMQILPRDFLKVGQLMLDGGSWDGRRILARDFVTQASSPLHDLEGIQYGYLWWNIEYPYKDRTVRAFFAGGNGGQTVMVVPDLDLAIAIFAGNYADRVSLQVQQDLVPNYILPAVRERGDDPNAPVVRREFTTPYGKARPGN